MSDVTCPHCGTGQEINHDDGYGYEDGEEYTQDCSCGKEFGFTTSISYNYEVFCENDEHKLEQSESPHEVLWSCESCDYYEVRR